MDFFADENVARPIVQWLRDSGHDVLYASEADPGIDDAVWLHRAEAESRLILTSDKDFGEIVFRDAQTSHGIILLRMDELKVPARIERLLAVWSVIQANPSGRFIVISANKIRVRELPRSV